MNSKNLGVNGLRSNGVKNWMVNWAGAQFSQIRRKGAKIAPFKHRGPHLHLRQTSGAAIAFKPKLNHGKPLENTMLELFA